MSTAAEQLCQQRSSIVREWSRRTIATLPSEVGDSHATADVAAVNEVFLSLVFDRVRAEDLEGLYDAYYAGSYALIAEDLRSDYTRKMMLDGLYLSGRTSLQVVTEHLEGDLPAQLAYTKLFSQLMMLVGLAYSDCRDEFQLENLDAVRRSREQFDLLNQLAQTIATADSLAAAMKAVLEKVCRATGWAVGEAWVPVPGGDELQCAWNWSNPVQKLRAFCDKSLGQSLPLGSGLPGSALQAAAPVWIEDVTDTADFVRRDAALKAGIRAAVALPVVAEDDVIAVLAFYLPEARVEDARLVAIVSAVAPQLGSFIRRREAEHALTISHRELERRVEERTLDLRNTNSNLELEISERRLVERALRTSEARYRAILDSTIDGIIVIDHQSRIVDFNVGAERMFGVPRATAVGKALAETVVPQRLRKAHNDGLRHFLETNEANVLDRRIELPAMRADGSEFPVEVSIVRVAGVEPPQFTGFLHDITERKNAEDELLREKRVSDACIDAMPGIFYLFGDDGVFLRWNDNFERVSGRTPSEIPHLHPLEFIEESDRQLVAKHIEETLIEGQTIVEAGFLTPDGPVPYYFTGRRVTFDGRTCVLGSGIDITERKKFEEAVQNARSAQVFRDVLASAPEAMVVTDTTGIIVLVNAQAERQFGYEPGELPGLSAGILLGDQNALRELLAGARDTDTSSAHGVGQSNARGARKDGVEFPIEITVGPIQTGDGLLIALAVRDVTERHLAEQQIRELNTELEGRVEERTAELARSNKDLEQFAYVASHDLQEPLRAVTGYSQLLSQRYKDQLDGDASRMLGSVEAAVDRMRALIEGLLSYSRVDSRARPFEPVDCSAVVDEVLDDLRVSIEESGAAVSCGALPCVVSDRAQLRQLLQNLIANALKFRGASPPVIRVDSRRDGDNYRFSVRDNGIGLDAQYADRVFLIFQRLHSRSRYPGTGIGLAICKKIVERHGGTIWVAPDVAAGAEFVFTLPVRADGDTASTPVGGATAEVALMESNP